MKLHHIEALLFIFVFATIFTLGYILAMERCETENANAHPLAWHIEEEG